MHPESIQSTPLRGILSDLLGAYGDCPDVHHLDQCPLPNRDAITRLLGDLREILFPGFGARQNLRSETLEYYVADVLLRLHEQLTEQIGRALRHSRPEAGCNWDDYRRTAQDLAEAFLAKLPKVMHFLQADIQAAYDGDPAAESKVETVFCYPGIEAVTIYRLAHELSELGAPLIPRLMTERAHAQTGIDIHPGATIGRSFFIDHGTGVVVGETCQIGDNVKLYQGVTLGALSFPKDEAGNIVRGQKRHPTLEDNVVVYANATILGGATVIGRNAVIGSSVWLTHSVKENTVVTLAEPELKFRESQKRA